MRYSIIFIIKNIANVVMFKLSFPTKDFFFFFVKQNLNKYNVNAVLSYMWIIVYTIFREVRSKILKTCVLLIESLILHWYQTTKDRKHVHNDTD